MKVNVATPQTLFVLDGLINFAPFRPHFAPFTGYSVLISTKIPCLFFVVAVYVIIALLEAFRNLVLDSDYSRHHNSKGRAVSGRWRLERRVEI